MVAILHVNVGLGGDSYLQGYRAVADRHGAVLVPDILSGILTNPDLKSDTIHPNAKGHRLIAERVVKTVRWGPDNGREGTIGEATPITKNALVADVAAQTLLCFEFKVK